MQPLTKDSIDLGTVNVFKLFRRYFVPTLLGMLGMSAVTAIDGICVGQSVGSNGIAAINICVPPMTLATGVGLMLGVGCSVVASIHLARGKVKAARLNVTQAMAIATILLLIPSAVIQMAPRQVAYWLGSSDTLLPLVVDYLRWYTPALVFQSWEAIALFIIRLDGSPRYAMACTLVTAIANAVLDVLFIFPLGWGVMGAAFATAISIVLGGLMAVWYLARRADVLRLLRPKWSLRSMMYSLRNVGYQCRLGSSALLGECLLAVLTFVGNLVFMRHLGDDGVGAFGIACYYTPFVFMVGNAIAQSAQPIISFNYGLGNSQRVAEALRIAIGTAVGSGLVVTALFVFAPGLLTSLFIPLHSSAGSIAVEGFPWFAASFVFYVLNLVFIGYFQSVERVWPAIVFSLLRGVVLLVPAFILLPLWLGNAGIWLALAASEAITTLCIVLFLGRNLLSKPMRLYQKEVI